MQQTQGQDYFHGTGRRKRGIARVRLTLGQGVITINKRAIDEYFPRPTLQMIVRQPRDVILTETQGPGFVPGPCCVAASLPRILRSARREASVRMTSRPAPPA